jgi:hypothetical protein
VLRPSSCFPGGLDQDVCWYTKLAVELSDHIEGQGALAVENFVNTGAMADYPDQGTSVLALLLQAEFDGIDRIRKFDGMVFALIGVD